MEQEIRRPDYVPRKHDRASSNLNCLLSAAGLTLMMLCLVGSAAAITGWALVKLVGLPDSFLLPVIGLLQLPVLWLTIWTAGRAWYTERRLATGQDVDMPVYRMLHYFKKPAS
jgi:hypothetical protein